MTTDDRMKHALRDVAADPTSTSDDELWAAIEAEAATGAAGGTGRWLRPTLVAASVAVVALVVGVVVSGDGDGDSDSELNLVDDPTTTVDSPTTTVDERTTTSSVPDEDGQDEMLVGPDNRPLVVVSDHGNRVTAYFSDGRDPIVYLPTEPVRHAEIGPDGTLWITTAGECVECGLTVDSSLVNVDPTSGERLETIKAAGFASVSPDGTQLAYAQLDPNAVVIGPLANDPNPGPGRVLLAHNPDGPVESSLWALGQIHWSPDGRRMLVQEFWEDDSVWLVDLENHDYVGDGTNLTIGGADWTDDNRLLATQYCCYAEPGEEPRHLVEVDLSGDEPVIMDRAEGSSGMVGVIPGGLDAAVHVADENLVRISTGDQIAEDVVSVQW